MSLGTGGGGQGRVCANYVHPSLSGESIFGVARGKQDSDQAEICQQTLRSFLFIHLLLGDFVQTNVIACMTSDHLS